MNRVLLIFAALCAMTVGAFAQCSSFPCVVATTSVTKQTHGIERTTVFTPTTDGMFRITAYLTVTKAVPNDGSAGEWFVSFRWNDGLRENAWITGTGSAGTNAGNASTIVAHSIAGVPIEYRTSILGLIDGMKYDLFIVVEQLQ